MNRQGSKDNPFGGIEWTHIFGPRSGYTVNPVRGCEHDCKWKMPDKKIAECYAKTIKERLNGKGTFEKITFHPEVLDEIRNKKESCGIFIDSMSDLFGKNVPRENIQKVIQTIEDCPQHVLFSLTKNPSRFREFSYDFGRRQKAVWLLNWLVGISAPPSFMFGKELSPAQQHAWLIRALEFLRDSPAQRRWISIEPLSFDVSEIIAASDCPLDWAVIGAASNGSQTFQPPEKDFTRCLDVLNAKGIPVFFKGNLDRKFVAMCGSDWRQEFPIVTDDQIIEIPEVGHA